ncbi:hypothetical protein OAR10_00280 [Candidatus Pelagibacter sp.]|nr:hypothetical protein [Candidatus Pelagibacter sp.]
MKKFIYLLITIFVFNISFITPSFSISGGIFKNIFNLFKSGGDDLIKNGDDAIRGIKNSTENINLGSAQETLIMNKVGAEAHVKELKNLKKTSRNEYLKIIRKNSDEFIDNDLLEFFEDDSSSTNSIFKKVIILNWIGKIYNNSDYFSKPTKDNKILLVCSNKDKVFYFSLLMEKEPKRVFLVRNLKIKNNEKSIPNQELSVLEDTKTIKIMSTLPNKDHDWPQHYFIIYNDQNFYYENIKLGNISPQTIKEKAMKKTFGKNNCSKATNEGLL